MRAWEERETHGEVIRLKCLSELITLPPVKGWGEDIKKVELLLKDDVEVLAKWRDAMVAEHGGDRRSGKAIKSDNITLEDGRGTSVSYTVSRLQHQSPSLFEKVKQGLMSANEAAIAAGFRKKTCTVVVGDANAAARTLLKHYPPADLIQAIKDQGNEQ